MWSTEPHAWLGRAISDTCNGEKEKCGGGGGGTMPNTFEAGLGPVMSVNE